MAPAPVPLGVGAVIGGRLSRCFSDRAQPSLQRRARKGALESPARAVRKLAAEAEAARPQARLQQAVTEDRTAPQAAPKITDLPAADQRTVLKLLDALHESRQRTASPRSKARAVS